MLLGIKFPHCDMLDYVDIIAWCVMPGMVVSMPRRDREF